MKIAKPRKLLIHSNYHPDNNGGIELVVRLLINSLSINDYEVTCFFGDNKNSNIVIDGHVNHISRRILIKVAGACILSWGNVKFFLSSLRSELVIFQEPYPSLWPAVLFIRYFLRKRVIVLVHANPVSYQWVMRLYNNLRSIVFSGAVCVATSPNLLSTINTGKFKKTYIVPLCIPQASESKVKSLKLPPRYAFYIGRIVQYKGIKFIIEAATTLPDITFILAGDGPLSNFISDEINLKQLKNIIFLNRFVTEAEKLELIENCEFVLFPSISENEAFGLVQLEAMRFRKAIINTYLNSGVNYVAPDSDCAVTVERCNANSLADAIKYLWTNPDHSKSLGENGFNRFQSLFSEISFVNSWQRIILDNLLENNQK